jgi:hypothetical protein
MSFSRSEACQPITVLACAPAGAGGCLVPQNTQCSAASGRSFAQFVHFFTFVSLEGAAATIR